MDNFMSNPETSMRIFFSSYFRDRGLIWSPARCLAFPTLIAFFLRFLLRSKAFTEPRIEKPLRRALAVVDLACKELPATARIGAILHDAFSEGGRDLWGNMCPAWNESVVPDEEKEGPATKQQKNDDSQPKLDAVKLPPELVEVRGLASQKTYIS